MKLATGRRVAGLTAMSAALALTIAACGPDSVDDGNGDSTSDETTAEDTGDAGEPASDLSGEIAGAGASSQENAQLGWMAGFTEANPGVSVAYDPVGSGDGRASFLNGAVSFAGSDAAFSTEEIEQATARCFDSEPLELPLYVSPIAVVYNLPGVDAEHINFTPEALAGAFTGEITSWNDPAIAEANPDVELPDTPLVPVNRSDDSGTTENFTEYLTAVAPDVWTHGPVETWPIDGTLSGAQTQGMIDTVSSTEGALGYADASRTEDLGTVAVGVGEEFVPYSAEAAAAVVDASPRTDDASELRLTLELARDTTESGTYPIVLVSYLIACSTYEDQNEADLVAAYLSYIASPEGQDRAAQPDVAGSAPISDDLRAEVEAAIAQISAG